MTLQELYEFAEKFVKVGKGSGTVSADINLYAAFGKVRNKNDYKITDGCNSEYK